MGKVARVSAGKTKRRPDFGFYFARVLGVLMGLGLYSTLAQFYYQHGRLWSLGTFAQFLLTIVWPNAVQVLFDVVR